MGCCYPTINKKVEVCLVNKDSDAVIDYNVKYVPPDKLTYSIPPDEHGINRSSPSHNH